MSFGFQPLGVLDVGSNNNPTLGEINPYTDEAIALGPQNIEGGTDAIDYNPNAVTDDGRTQQEVSITIGPEVLSEFANSSGKVDGYSVTDGDNGNSVAISSGHLYGYLNGSSSRTDLGSADSASSWAKAKSGGFLASGELGQNEERDLKQAASSSQGILGTSLVRHHASEFTQSGVSGIQGIIGQLEQASQGQQQYNSYVAAEQAAAAYQEQIQQQQLINQYSNLSPYSQQGPFGGSIGPELQSPNQSSIQQILAEYEEML